MIYFICFVFYVFLVYEKHPGLQHSPDHGKLFS